MAKMRVYELAKELGLENKVVISKAQELGISGITSHSNSVGPGEADQIRRAVLRQTLGTRPEKEVVKTSVDKETGEKSTVVERRKGNVIRRRRRAGETDSEAAEEKPAAEEPAKSEEPEEQEAAPVEAAAEEEVQEKPEEKKPETAAAPPPEEETEEEPSTAEAAAEARSEEEAETPVEEVGEDKKVGPKVLGRIELEKTAPKKPAPKRSKVRPAPGAVEEVPIDDDEERRDGKRRGKGRSRRSKKRAFSRTELVDYEGSPARKPGRTRGTRKGSSSDSDDKEAAAPEITTPKASKRVVKMDEVITVGDFADQMSLKSAEVITKLMELGVMATINQVIDEDTATIVAEEFGYTLESTSFDETEILQIEEEKDPEKLVSRPPVVTVMGHVDHGKTSLLDTIRKTSVVDKEHGGITQHIGAYQVKLPDERLITFLDTPGHAAFTSMRARGAEVTDVVVLVVAADDGVMPQTVEAIDHAKAADVPIVVAVNKMDKQGANPDKVKQQLAERGLQPEDWGGETLFFPVSAIQQDGIEELLEGILLVAELKDLKAVPEGRAAGTIVEARQERGRGTVATVLVRSGILNVGDVYVAGAEHGRIRSMLDYKGDKVEEAGPSVPVEITGLSGVPEAGDDFVVVESETKAKTVAEHRAEQRRVRDAAALGGGPISLEEFARQAKAQAAAELNIIVKADVHGSLEAVRESVLKLSTEKVKVQVLHGGVGAVSESDIQLAIASRALVVGFNVRAEPRAAEEAEKHGIETRFYRVIYELLDDVRSAMTGLLDPIKQEKQLGRVEVRDTFSVPKLGKIAGGYVMEGIARRGAFVRLLRDSAVVYEGKMHSLRRFKDDVKEVQSGYECGIGIENYNDIKIGDVLELYEIEEVAATLE